MTKTILDDLSYIHTKDSEDALGIASRQWSMLHTEYDIPDLNYDVENIVCAGMGGSALWGLLSKTWPGYTIPFELWQTYNAPHYINKKTLLIVNSYSGNTEETISALEAGEQAKAHIVVVASGGKLATIAQEKGYPLAILPKSSQPRYATLNGLKALVEIFKKVGVLQADNIDKDLHAASLFLKTNIEQWGADSPTVSNKAKQIALDVAGTSPVIYSGSLLFPAAYKWKISFNENAKNVAWCNEIPEFSHNEFIGWTSHPVEKPYSVIDLRSSFEHPRIQKRFQVTEQLLSGRRPSPIIVNAKGETILEHLLYCVVLGEFVSIYVALLNGLNPTPVDLIETMKSLLDT